MINAIRKIKIKVHPLFWLVAIAAFWTGQFLELMTLFTLVVIHELGHIFAAFSVGWRVHSMELLPFGGVAKVDEWGTTRPKDEIFVALAGPFLNLVMIVIGWLFLSLQLWQREWGLFFIEGNALIALFNLLPLWPLDGGKVLHAILSKLFAFHHTIYATLAWSGAWIFLLLVFSFLFTSPINLLIICLYLLVEIRIAWKRAHYQFIRFLLEKQNQNKNSLDKLPISAIYVLPSDKIGEVVKMIKKGYYHHFHVLDTSRNMMVYFPEETILAIFFKNPQHTISEFISRQ